MVPFGSCSNSCDADAVRICVQGTGKDASGGPVMAGGHATCIMSGGAVFFCTNLVDRSLSESRQRLCGVCVHFGRSGSLDV